MSGHSWLAQVPYGGGRGGVVEQPRGLAVGALPAGDLAPAAGLVLLSAAGLAVFAGGGALLGWALLGTRTAAWVGALLGVATPPLVYAVGRAGLYGDQDPRLVGTQPGGY